MTPEEAEARLMSLENCERLQGIRDPTQMALSNSCEQQRIAPRIGHDPELGAPLTDQLLHRPNCQPLLDNLLDHLLLEGSVGCPEQGPGVAGRDGPLGQSALGSSGAV